MALAFRLVPRSHQQSHHHAQHQRTILSGQTSFPGSLPGYGYAANVQSTSRNIIAPRTSDTDLREEQPDVEKSAAAVREMTPESEEDTEHHHAKSSWHLDFTESIYSKALLAPLVHRSPQGACNASVWLSATVLLALNMCLQTAVLFKVQTLTESRTAEYDDKLFGDYGLCHPRFADSIPLAPKLEPNEKYYDCGPLTPVILSNTSIVDINHDGIWQQQEANEAAKEWHAKFHKVVQLSRSFEKLMAKARTGSLLAQHESNLTEKDWENATRRFTELPISWVKREQLHLALCAIPDPSLCGNLEVRGILTKMLPHIRVTEDRLEACEHIIGYECPDIYGEVFKSYKAWGSSLCGDADQQWNDKLELMTTRFSLAHKYSPVKAGGSTEGISTPVFQVFVTIILMIWWMSIFTEWRSIIDWWVVVIFMPLEQPGVPTYLREDEDQLEVTAMPLNVKLFTIVFNIIPRTLIGVTVAFVGTDFLIGSDSYMDLILNSVALTFLVQIDEMLFAALMSRHEKADIDTCGSIQATHPWFSPFDFVVFNLPTPLIRAAALILLCTGFMLHSYIKQDGKYDMGYALSCLCQAEGSYCMAAQLMGGLESVSVAPH